MKRSILGLIVAVTVAAPLLAQGTPDASSPSATNATQRTDDSAHHDYGWIGLLGLAGLAGLRKRDHTARSVSTAPSTAR